MFPKTWKSGVTVLDNKKDDPNEPENFHLVTFQRCLRSLFEIDSTSL